jgi:hypothetical protein
MLPEPLWPLRRLEFLRAGALVTGAAGVTVGVAPGVGSAGTTVSTGEGNGVGVVVGLLKGVEETVGVAVCFGVDVAVCVGVDVTVGAWSNTVAAGVRVAVPVALGVGSWASAAPPITAA